jgi:hypothetical protein
VYALVELVRWNVHNTGLSVARTLPAEAVEAIGEIGSFLGCSIRKKRRERSEPTKAGEKSFVLFNLSMVPSPPDQMLRGRSVRVPCRRNTGRVFFL